MAVSNSSRVTYEATIERIFQHNLDTRSFFLRLLSDQQLTWKAGQFLSLLLPIAGETLIRPYSIASSPEEGNLLEICLNLVPAGPGSHYLFARTVGETLRFTGPWGTFVFDQPPPAECVFIADGTGIAPIRPMIRRALASGRQPPLQLLYSALQGADLLYRQDWEAYAQTCSWFSFTPLLSNPPSGWSGLPDSLAEYVERRYVSEDSDRSRHFYICGVGQQVTQLRDLLRRAGYQRRAVQYEKW
ncbi:MAG: FAD-dependent oxidoreductase [Deltaproteobacteria bacterium]|nr:FAD-dependent oxidoreductase [Deltaproteobacteria bacterium]